MQFGRFLEESGLSWFLYIYNYHFKLVFFGVFVLLQILFEELAECKMRYTKMQTAGWGQILFHSTVYA